MYVPPPESKESLVREWHKNYRVAQYAHYEAGKRLSRLHWTVGVPMAATSTVAGSATFATLDSSGLVWVRVLCGAVFLIVAVLAGIMSFARFAERAETHRATAVSYGKLKRMSEQLLVRDGPVQDSDIESLREEADRVASVAPHLSQKLHAATLKKIQQEDV